MASTVQCPRFSASRRSGVRTQGTGEDKFRGRGDGAVAALDAAVTARVPEAQPVRCAVDRAAEAERVDERLQQQQRMAEAFRPVRDQAPLAQRQQPRSQVGPIQPGRIRKRLLSATRCNRSYCTRKSQPIQASRARHFNAGAEKPISATYSRRRVQY